MGHFTEYFPIFLAKKMGKISPTLPKYFDLTELILVTFLVTKYYNLVWKSYESLYYLPHLH